jgi:hypothetical protein
MGIYLFRRDVVLKLLDNNLTDFGKHIIPAAIENPCRSRLCFSGYWEDVGHHPLVISRPTLIWWRNCRASISST